MGRYVVKRFQKGRTSTYENWVGRIQSVERCAPDGCPLLAAAARCLARAARSKQFLCDLFLAVMLFRGSLSSAPFAARTASASSTATQTPARKSGATRRAAPDPRRNTPATDRLPRPPPPALCAPRPAPRSPAPPRTLRRRPAPHPPATHSLPLHHTGRGGRAGRPAAAGRAQGQSQGGRGRLLRRTAAIRTVREHRHPGGGARCRRCAAGPLRGDALPGAGSPQRIWRVWARGFGREP